MVEQVNPWKLEVRSQPALSCFKTASLFSPSFADFPVIHHFLGWFALQGFWKNPWQVWAGLPECLKWKVCQVSQILGQTRSICLPTFDFWLFHRFFPLCHWFWYFSFVPSWAWWYDWDFRMSGNRNATYPGFPGGEDPTKSGARFFSSEMGVSKNNGTQKWMVYNGKPY